MSKKVVAIIPARYGSTRFPGKPLVPLLDRPMIEWVYRRTARCKLLDRVLVATDDRRIKRAVQEFGGEAVMTASEHPTGTDRLAEVVGELDADFIINVQGDEPLVRPEMLEDLLAPLFNDENVHMTTLATDLQGKDLEDPHRVKVVTDIRNYALYFSRAPIPFPWNSQGASSLLHLGFYGFRRDFLLRFPLLPRTPLEQRESLEQLRVLEHGYCMGVVYTQHRTIGVDRPSDLDVVTGILREEEKL